MDPEKCLVCTKTVYPTEKINTDGRIYHKGELSLISPQD